MLPHATLIGLRRMAPSLNYDDDHDIVVAFSV